MDFLDNIFGNLFGGIDQLLSNLFGGGRRKTFKKNPMDKGPRPSIEAPRMGLKRPMPTRRDPTFSTLTPLGRAPKKPPC